MSFWSRIVGSLKKEMDTFRSEMREHLIDEEGFENNAYPDHLGNITIGVGRKIWPGGFLRDDEVEYLLGRDLDAIEQFGSTLPYWSLLSVNRRIVLGSMYHQLGHVGFLRFKKMREALEAGDYEKAADEILDSDVARDQAPARFRRHAKMMREG